MAYRNEFNDTEPLTEGRFMPKLSRTKVYLTILDRDLSPISEGNLPEANNYHPFHFAKDGKRWIFENLEDEMGFVRMDITW